MLRAIAVVAACWCAGAAAAPAAKAGAYLDHALTLMERHSLHRDEIDWNALREKAFAAAEDAESPADTYPALRLALRMLGDNHSALIPPGDGQPRFREAAADEDGMPTGRRLGRAAYLRVPGHAGGDAVADLAYAESLHALIQRLDDGACGWVIDLRDNPGGNMWPMLAGLQPLLGRGVVGGFRYPDGESTPWWVEPGAAGAGRARHASTRFAYGLRDADAPVALLVGPATASSGEAVVVAFAGRPATRTFGSATFGVTTGNRGFVLPDGAIMFVTASRFTDRDGNVYGGKLEPDVPTEAADTLDAALRWLSAQGCGGV